MPKFSVNFFNAFIDLLIFRQISKIAPTPKSIRAIPVTIPAISISLLVQPRIIIKIATTKAIHIKMINSTFMAFLLVNFLLALFKFEQAKLYEATVFLFKGTSVLASLTNSSKILLAVSLYFCFNSLLYIFNGSNMSCSILLFLTLFILD